MNNDPITKFWTPISGISWTRDTRQRPHHFSLESMKATRSLGLSHGNSTFNCTRPNPPSRPPGRRSRYEPRHLSDNHPAVHRAVEARDCAVAEALVCRPEHRLAQTLPRNQRPAPWLRGLSIPVLDQFQAGARPWRPCEEGREIHAGHLLQDPRKAGRSREHGHARGRQARSHSVRPVGECFQSRPDRRHPGSRDHSQPERVTASRKGGCHR